MSRDKFWQKAFVKLVVHARKHMTSNADEAQDLAQGALEQAWQSSPPGEALDELVKRATWIMKGALSNARRATKMREDDGWRGRAAAATRPPKRTPEQIAATRERGARLFAALERKLEKDADGLALVEQARAGLTEAADQAEALGWDIERVRTARKRLNRAIEAVREEDEEQAAPESARTWNDDESSGEDAGEDVSEAEA